MRSLLWCFFFIEKQQRKHLMRLVSESSRFSGFFRNGSHDVIDVISTWNVDVLLSNEEKKVKTKHAQQTTFALFHLIYTNKLNHVVTKKHYSLHRLQIKSIKFFKRKVIH